MKFADLTRRAEKLVADNSPLILTGIAVTGTVATAILASKASFKAADILREEGPRDKTLKEKFHLLWKLYIPAVTTGALTCACIIGANRIGTRRAAVMAAAYSISEKAFQEYKEKVVEQIGVNKEQMVRDEIAQDQVMQNPPSSREVIITDGGDVLCYDSITGRYFQSSVEALRKAQNDVNQQIIGSMYASLYEFYDLIGLPATPYSTEVGWNSDTMLELNFSTVLSEDGKPCISVNYNVWPIRDYPCMAGM